ncbi:MAG: hypothetical protein WCV81_05480 [Microgenomates group bacterium]|jgi:uncharacterized repeat protein (TIGR01451 family)
MKTHLFGASAIILSLFSFIAVPSALAQYTPPQPTPAYKFFIDKKIFNPSTEQYVDNLNRDQYLYIPDQTVDFKIEVKNTGDIDLNSVDITDQLPAQLIYVSGGSINKGGQIHFFIDRLTPGQTQSFLLKAKVKVTDETGVVCPVNLAEARTGSLLDQDTSAFCITRNINKKVAPVEELPKTGLPLAAWSLVGFLPAGFGLKRFSRTNKDNLDRPLHIWQKREFEKES